MRLIEVPAKTGYLWFRQGIWVFRRNPPALLLIFFVYLLAMMLAALVPIVGVVLPIVCIPVVSVGFMAASRDVVAGKSVSPMILLQGLQGYGSQTARRLLILGAMYLLAMIAVLVLSALMDGGAFMRLMVWGVQFKGNGADVGKTLIPHAQSMRWAALWMIAAYIPVSMLFWFAPVLTAWHGIPPSQAVFFSLMACWRNRWAFGWYSVIWGALAFAVSLAIALLMQALELAAFTFALLMPISMVLTTVLYCSFYATYRGCFGAQQDVNVSVMPDSDSASLK